MKEKRGVALIIVLVLLFLFSIIILTVVLTTTSAYRRSAYFRDKLTAQNLAEIGIEDALYKLNYRYHDSSHYYGFRTDGECWPDTGNLPQNGNTYTYTMRATDFGIPLASVNDGVEVTLQINDGTYGDTLIATGHFRGRRVKVQTNIRTASASSNLARTLDDVGNSDTKGVPEAFNKHVIYAGLVSGTTTVVKGNITTTSQKPAPFTWSEATWTETSSVSIPVLSLSYKPEDPDKREDQGGLKPLFSSGKKFKDDDGSTPYGGSSPYESALPPGVAYNVNVVDMKEVYTISTAAISEDWQFEQNDTLKSSGYSLEIRITQTTSLSSGNKIISGASGDTAAIVLDFSGTNNPNIQGQLVAERDITINTGNASPNPIGTVGSVTLWAGNNLTINNTSTMPQINGDIIGINKVEFTGSSQVTLNGSINSEGTITILQANLTINIDATNSQRKGAIVLYKESDATLSLTTQPTDAINITIGNNQVGGILIYFYSVTAGGTGKKTDLDLQGTITFNSPSNKFFLINHSEEVANNFNITPSNLTGSIYSAFYRDMNQTINFNGNVKGSIITNGTVNLNGGSLIYDPGPYKSSDIDVYTGFVGGRRIFLPRNWKVIW
jgi:hypothetical protein